MTRFTPVNLLCKLLAAVRLPSSKFSAVLIIGLAANLSACSLITKQVEWETIEPDDYPVLTAVGYAPIAQQHGMDESSKIIMAMRAAKLDAYRELAEQVYGQKLNGTQTLANMVLDNAHLKASVEGVIRGAQVIKTYPVGENTYATELALDMRKVYDLYLATARPQRVKDVKYY